ncbi:transporter [Ornithinibacillus halophilus]|nr:transporter [Ornithinibacillus halophilus]
MLKIIYEVVMITLVIITIMTIWTEDTYNPTINWIVWGIFLVDFITRLTISKNKWEFIKGNPFLLIAIIPIDQFFQLARIVRIFYYFRIKTIAKYYITPYVKKINTQFLSAIVAAIIILLLLEASILWQVESSIDNYWQGIYVTFGHLLFFGHKLFAIQHGLSVWLLTITSIVGIIIQGLALQWLFNKLDHFYGYMKEKNSTKAS